MGHSQQRSLWGLLHGTPRGPNQCPRRLHHTVFILDNWENVIGVSGALLLCLKLLANYSNNSSLENENNLLLKILRIQFPHPASAGPIEFEELGSLQVPWSLAAELHFLDASQQMICAVFENGDQQTTGINVIFDWKDGLVFMCDTGVPYVRSTLCLFGN